MKPSLKNSSDWIHQYYITLYNIIIQHTFVFLHIVWMQIFFWVQSWLIYECLYFHWWHRISLVQSYAITEHVSWLAQYKNKSVNVSPTDILILLSNHSLKNRKTGMWAAISQKYLFSSHLYQACMQVKDLKLINCLSISCVFSILIVINHILIHPSAVPVLLKMLNTAAHMHVWTRNTHMVVIVH